MMPEEQGQGEGLAVYQALVATAHPDLAGAPIRLLGAGWDCVGLDVDDRLIIKVPRHQEGAIALERETKLLDLVRPAVTIPVPEMRFFHRPRAHSLHRKLQGVHLLPADYASLPEATRTMLAEDLARFFAELHAIPLSAACAAGARPEAPWPPLAEIARLAIPHLPAALHANALAVLDAYANRGPDPLGEVLGHFDTHGWNMAWDHSGARLNGLYDFGDAAIGEVHREFVAPGLLSTDLVARIISTYERLTGRSVDRTRMAVLAGAARLRELADEAISPAPFTRLQAIRWVEAGADALARN